MITSKEVNDFFLHRRDNMKQPIFNCHNCGWTPKVGEVIGCDSITEGPWHCPTCGYDLPEITLREVKKEEAPA